VIKRVALAASLILLFLSVGFAHAAMLKIPFEQLWEGADTVVIGTVEEITHHWGERGLIYRIVKLGAERYYKDPSDAETLHIRVEGGTIGDQGVWVEDQPEFDVGEHVLLFLSLTEEKFGDEPLYEVYGLFQGKFVVRDGTAIGPGGVCLEITEDSITLRPEGEAYLVECEFEEPVIACDIACCRLGFTNDGGQPDYRNFTITFRGVEGPAAGREETHYVWGGASPGGYGGENLELNFTEPGVYEVLVDGVRFRNFTVHETGFPGKEYEFTELKIEPVEALVEQRVNITFSVKSLLDEPSKCLYRLKVVSDDETIGETNLASNIPMMSELQGSDSQTVEWWEERRVPGTYTVSVWHRGERVLQGTFTVGSESAQTKGPPQLGPTAGPSPFIPDLRYLAIMTGLAMVIILLIKSTKMWRVLRGSDPHARGSGAKA